MSLELDNQARIRQLEFLYSGLRVKTEKIIIDDTEPENPTLGTAWFDTSNLMFKTWNGQTWDSGTVTSLTIGTTPNWFRVDGSGNMWSGRDTLALAQSNTFAVLNTGVLYAKNAVISGTITITSGSSGIANLTDAGVLATVNNLDGVPNGSTYLKTTSNEKTGAGYAYVGLNSSGEVVKLVKGVNLPTTGMSTGLNITGSYMGYYDGSAWKSYIQSNGYFYFGGDATHYVQWNGTDLVVRGNIYAVNGTFTGSITSSATITGGIIQSASSGARIELSSTNGLRSFDSGGNVRLRMPTDGFGMTFFTSAGTSVGRIQGGTIASGTWSGKRVIAIDNNGTSGDGNLYVENDFGVVGTGWISGKLKIPVGTNLY